MQTPESSFCPEFLLVKSRHEYTSISKTDKGCWRLKIVCRSKTGRGKRSQASKVLGTTMDTGCTAWLDQAQWGPGQNQPPVASPSLHPFLWLSLLAGIKCQNLSKSREFSCLATLVLSRICPRLEGARVETRAPRCHS